MIEVLYFSAPWCGPCKVMGPVVEELKAEGHNITKINSDESKALVQEHGVFAIPTFIILKDGQPVRRIQGAHQKASLENEIRIAAGAC